MPEDPAPFWTAVETIRAHDERLRPEAYGFVMAALGWAVERLPSERRQDPVRRHLSGGELVQAVTALAADEFGRLAPMVLESWGLTSNEAVGRIVFQLVDARQLSARPEDTLDDFLAAPDVLAALRAAEPGNGADRT